MSIIESGEFDNLDHREQWAVDYLQLKDLPRLAAEGPAISGALRRRLRRSLWKYRTGTHASISSFKTLSPKVRYVTKHYMFPLSLLLS